MICLTQTEVMEVMDTLESFRIAAVIGSVVFLLFKTDFISEYACLFRLDRFFNISGYRCHKIKHSDSNYFSFLNSLKDNFFTRLMSCPFCLGFWFCCSSFFFQCNILLTYCFYLIILKVVMSDLYEQP